MKTITLALGTLALMTSVAAHAVELPEAMNKKITVDINTADVKNVYRLYGDVMGAEMRVDACLDGRKVDIKLKNAPMSVVLDVMAAKLDAVHAIEGNVVSVGCRGKALSPTTPSARKEDDPRLEKRVTIDVKDASIETMLNLLADMTGAEVHVYGKIEGRRTMALTNVRLATLLAAIRESFDLADLELNQTTLNASAREPTDDDASDPR